jgi:dihydroorotate dehydrogenase
MGFNNVGSEQAAAALARSRIRTVVGINICKTKVVDVDQAVQDYVRSFRNLFPWASYFTVNVSSPNTPGLRTLQDRGPLSELLAEILQQNRALAKAQATRPRPVLLKIAPDLNPDQLADIAALAGELRIDGIIATNTTVAREHLQTSPRRLQEIGAGGLSGKPLTGVSRQIVKRLYQLTDRAIPLVGVGGIMSGEDAWAMIGQGASLLQVYTGFVYGGPFFVRRLNDFLSRQLQLGGYDCLADAVGWDNRPLAES